ncbi:MAG: hypothetical protein PHW48_03180 [Candidatus Pacebacteria bacterium]|nr:hypothetical protein [Candidatus Paceibacterota bacterium]
MNKLFKKNSSFTSIKLLVVITILGLLTSIAPNKAISHVQNAQNTKLLNELSNLAQVLQEKESYPLGSFCIEDNNNEDAKRFKTELGLDKVPRHPEYKDGDTHLTTNNCFLYFSDGNEYSIRLPALGNKGYLIQESRHPEVKAIQEKCDEGWIPFGNRCVMQYEAREVEGIATSQAEQNPWKYISQINAKKECEKINAHLITNAEWMALARDIEAQDENWTGGAVGKGVLKRGNVGNVPGGYKGPDLIYNEAEANRPSTSLARLVLSNGESIWDLSGNIWEFVDNTIAKDDLPSNSNDWVDFSNALFHEIHLPEAELVPLKAIDPALGSGKLHYGYERNGNDPRVFIRGGLYANDEGGGVFALALLSEPWAHHVDFGFRCVK